MKTLVSKFLIIAIPFILFNCQKKEADQVKPNSNNGELNVTVIKSSRLNNSANSRQETVINYISLALTGNNWGTTNVNVDLYKGSFAVTRIATNVPSNSTALYPIPDLVQYGSDFSVKITNTSNNSQTLFSNLFPITGTTTNNLANMTLEDSYPQLGERVNITSIPTTSLNYIVRIKYTLNGQVQYQEVHTNTDANPLPTKTTAVTIWTNPGLANSNIVLQLVHNNTVVQEVTRTIFPTSNNIASLSLNDTYPQLGETVSITGIPNATYDYSVRIKYTLNGQVQYQAVHTNSGATPLLPKSSLVTLWTNPGLAYSNIGLQVVQNNVVVQEFTRTIFP